MLPGEATASSVFTVEYAIQTCASVWGERERTQTQNFVVSYRIVSSCLVSRKLDSLSPVPLALNVDYTQKCIRTILSAPNNM